MVFCLSLVRFCFHSLVIFEQMVCCPLPCSHHILCRRISGSYFGGSPSALSPAMHLPQLRPVTSKVFLWLGTSRDPGNEVMSIDAVFFHVISIFPIFLFPVCAFCLSRSTRRRTAPTKQNPSPFSLYRVIDRCSLLYSLWRPAICAICLHQECEHCPASKQPKPQNLKDLSTHQNLLPMG